MIAYSRLFCFLDSTVRPPSKRSANTRLLATICLVVVSALLPLSPAHAASSGLESTIGYLVSSDTLDSVAALPPSHFEPFDFGKQLGFVDEPAWVSIVLAEIPKNDNVVLVISPVYMDEIDVYLARDTSQLLLSAGDTRHSPPSLDRYGYTLKLGPDFSNERLLIRLRSDNAIQLAVRVASVESLAIQNALSWSVLAVCFAVLAICSLWAGISLRQRRSRLVAWFLARCLGLAVTMLVHQGLLRFLLPGESMPPLNGVHNFLTFAYITLSQTFDYLLLHSVVKRRAAAPIFWLVVAFTVSKAVLYFSGSIIPALILNQISVLAVLVLSSIVLLRHWPEKKSIAARGLGLYYLLQGAPVLLLYVVSYLVNSAPLFFQEVIFSVYGVFVAGFVGVVLYSRQRAVQKESERIAKNNRELAIRAEMESKRRQETANLMHMLSHEIKTPLATLQIASELGDLSQSRVQDAVDKMVHVLEQCDNIEQAQEGTAFLEFSDIDIASLTNQLCRKFEIDATWTSPASSRVIINSNLDALSIVITNLLTNADKHRIRPTPIEISLSQDDSEACLRVSNKAVLHDQENLSRLFGKYTRDSSSSSIAGSGLGLSIVSSLVERLEGRVELRFEHNQFIAELFLPLCAVQSPRLAKAADHATGKLAYD